MLKGWKKRYFKQDGKKLFYFSSKTDKESLGYIFIPSIIEIRKNSETQFDIFLNKNGKKFFTFKLFLISNNRKKRKWETA